MVLPSDIDQQIELEKRAIRYGIDKLERDTRQCEEREYASGSVAGRSVIQEMVPLVESELEKTKTRIKRGQSGKYVGEVSTYLDSLDSLEIATIGLKVVFDMVFSKKPEKKGKMPPWCLANVLEKVGTALENECKMRAYEKACPGLYNCIKESYWRNTSGTHQKVTVMSLLMERREEVPKWKRWGIEAKGVTAAWVLDAVSVTGLFIIEKERGFRQFPIQSVLPSETLKEQLSEVLQQATDFSAARWPMLIPPNDWSQTKPGGYLLNEVMRGHHMVRRGHLGTTQPQQVIDFLNNLQKVAYRVDTFVLDVAKQLHALGHKQGSFKPRTWRMPDVPQPFDAAEDPTVMKAWRHEQKVVHNTNYDYQRSLCVRTEQQLEVAELFKDRERFYLPWSFDYRGRVYPIPTILQPQDTSFGKSLIRFAEPVKMNRRGRWSLAVWVANTFGLDKLSYKDRVRWTLDNHELITLIATDPLGNLPLWDVGDDWLFLAACKEYYDCCIAKTKDTTDLMIGIDATQSGLQVLAGLVRDAITAALTNVLGAAKPADAYQRVADRANELLIERGRPDLAILTRGDVKRVTMTIPYNATRYSNFEYIRQALPELFPYIPGITKEQKDKQKEDVVAIVNAVRGNDKDLIGAMQEIVPGALETMKWLNAQVAYWLREGATMLTWRSPSGFITTQILMKPDIVRMELKLYGCARKVNLKSKDSDIVDKAGHQSATAPNLIHSLDAALLHIALADAENFSIIHDCILCRAPEVFTVQKRIREAYKQCFSGDIIFLEEWAKKMKAETMPHIFDTFDPADVVESLYFYN